MLCLYAFVILTGHVQSAGVLSQSLWKQECALHGLGDWRAAKILEKNYASYHCLRISPVSPELMLVVVQLPSRVRLFETPHRASLSFCISQSLLKTLVSIESVAIRHLLLIIISNCSKFASSMEHPHGTRRPCSDYELKGLSCA